MNKLNYASLEASKRLVDAGIVLETGALWSSEEVKTYIPRENDAPKIVSKRKWVLSIGHSFNTDFYPAPSMAEIWRELPERIGNLDGYEFLRLDKDENDTTCGYGLYAETGRSPNPTDALIDLLIWVRKEKP